MPKAYTFLDVAKPTSPSATAVTGGSLLASTTYYYRVMKVTNLAGENYWFGGRSQMSDQFSVTTDATNKTARITFTCPYDAGYSYRIWRSTSSTAIGTSYLGHIGFYPTDNLYNTAGTVTFDDDGTYTTTSNNYAEIDNQAHGALGITGSTSSDPFSIVDLYNADIAAGWGVIQKLDVNTYKVNCYLNGHASMYWTDINKTIIFADGVSFATTSVFSFGVLSGNTTSFGCEIIVTSPWLTGIQWGTLNAYRTIFKYVYPSTAISNTSGLGLTSANISGGTLQDCQVDRFRNFSPTSNVVLKNFIASRFDNLFSNSSATYENVKCLTGSRIWQVAGGNINIVAKGVFSESTYAVLVLGSNSTSSLTTIDSIISQTILINSASTGFRYYDKFSYNLTITDGTGVGVASVNLKMYDKDNGLIVNATSNASGVVAEQIITRRYYEVDGMSVLPVNNRGAFTIVVSKSGYETYTEVINPTLSDPVVKIVALKPVKKIRQTVEGNVFIANQPELGSSSKMLAV